MTAPELPARYDPSEAEPRIVERWLADGFMHPQPEGSPEENYSIAIPPPNVTGSLHMGHALNGSIQDVLIRLARMRGRRTKWILGTDHAGIATQTQVEKQVQREGTTREDLGRAAFIERVWSWREQYGGTIIGQFERLGATCDYEDERFTLDERYAEAVLEVFVALYRKDLIYRDHYMVNWDPGTRSAISDLEVEDREVTDTLCSIAYDVEGGGEVVVATVRPETMLGDTAVAVNPGDERYAHLVGKTAILPLVGRRLPIIADDYVKTDFGTGCLKITPAHDPNDFEIGRKHGLEEVGVIGEDGRMTPQAGEPFAGMTAMEARAAVLAALEAEGRIRAQEPYTHVVPHSHRSGERIEPLISLQWFMRMDELAAPAIAAVKEGRLRFTPERWGRVYLDWLENIRPWCISRQLWWGHQLPVWYRDKDTHVGTQPPEGDGWERDPDVLDTWFSSGLWPFATLGWPERTPELAAFYPTDVLVTGRDIIFLWVARMVMFGIEFTGELPFSDVYITSIIQAPDGRRMSKSLGTGIDPLDVIAGGERPPVFSQGGEFPAYGADAVRYGLLAMSSTQDVRFSEERVAQGGQLANKLWNASRLVLAGIDRGVAPEPRPAAIEDRWILSRLERAKEQTAAAIDAYDFSVAALGLYDFVFAELCDWYLELVKPRLYESEGKDREALSATLLHVLRETLAIAHPVIPFVTEAIWEHVGSGLLATSSWPSSRPELLDGEAEAELAAAIGTVQTLRGWRDGMGAKASAVIPARLAAEGLRGTAGHVARLARMDFAVAGRETEEPVASIAVPGGAVHVLASDAVDTAAAAERVTKQREHLQAEIERVQRKLGNEGFVAKAPPAVVEGERDKLATLQAQLAEL